MQAGPRSFDVVGDVAILAAASAEADRHIYIYIYIYIYISWPVLCRADLWRISLQQIYKIEILQK